MATPGEVEQAVRRLVDRLAEVEPDLRRKYAVDRTVSCSVTDLEVTWTGRLCEDGLTDVTDDSGADKAQVRLTVSSDDLLALADGRLAVPTAWATGRLRIAAGPLDLLRLRSLL